ncbi:Protein croquemort [Anthophora retusa]
MKLWKKLAIIFTIGIVLAIVGLTLGILWSTIYVSIINTQLALTPSSTNYELWEATPIPMYLKLYMFNLTNYEDFLTGNDTKPHFVEMGPYVFREVDYKVNLTWNENSTITYQRKRIWHFDEKMSVGQLSDEVTNVNPVTASVAYALRYKKPMFRDMVDRIMKAIGQKLIITKTVNELLFEGYNDTMLKIARKFNFTEIPFDKFAWFYGRNESAPYDGTFNMFTGASNLLDVGVLKEWNYNSKVDYYPGECGVVKGTNGDLWPPLPDNQTVSFFVSDICTSLSIPYEEEIVHEGLTGLKYSSDYTIFDNADESYRQSIDGMRPSKVKHELSIAIEPKTGVPLNVNAKLQLNLLVQHDDDMSTFKNIKTTFVPMLWFTQEAYLTSDYASTVKFIIVLQSLGSITCYGIACIGILIICIGAFLYIRHGLRGEDNQVLLARNDNGVTTING